MTEQGRAEISLYFEKAGQYARAFKLIADGKGNVYGLQWTATRTGPVSRSGDRANETLPVFLAGRLLAVPLESSRPRNGAS